MSYFAAFFRFWYDFLVGDDWRIAVSIVIVLALTAATAHWLSATGAGAVLLAGILLTAGTALQRAVRGR